MQYNIYFALCLFFVFKKRVKLLSYLPISPPPLAVPNVCRVYQGEREGPCSQAPGMLKHEKLVFLSIKGYFLSEWEGCDLSPPPPSDGMRCCRSDWPGLCFFCCYQPLCVVSQQSWFWGVFFFFINFPILLPGSSRNSISFPDARDCRVRVGSWGKLGTY